MTGKLLGYTQVQVTVRRAHPRKLLSESLWFTGRRQYRLAIHWKRPAAALPFNVR